MKKITSDQVYMDAKYPKDFKSAIDQIVGFTKLKKKNPRVMFNKEGDIFFNNNHRRKEVFVYLIFAFVMIFLFSFFDFSRIFQIISLVIYLPAMVYFYHSNFRALNNVYINFKTKTIQIIPRAYLLNRIFPQQELLLHDIESFELKSINGGNSNGYFYRIFLKTNKHEKAIPMIDIYGVRDSKLILHCFELVLLKNKKK